MNFEGYLVKAHQNCTHGQSVPDPDGTLCIGCARNAFEAWWNARVAESRKSSNTLILNKPEDLEGDDQFVRQPH